MHQQVFNVYSAAETIRFYVQRSLSHSARSEPRSCPVCTCDVEWNAENYVPSFSKRFLNASKNV